MCTQFIKLDLRVNFGPNKKYKKMHTVPSAKVAKFSTVFGTVFPKSPITIRPVFLPPISISKNI